MIRLICGPKGTGKTKTILSELSESVKIAKGNVVFITEKKIHSANIDFSVRCVYTDEFNIKSSEAFRGFTNGLVAGNADIEYLFIDGLIKIIKDQGDGFIAFVKDIERLEKEYGFKAFLTVSLTKEELPEAFKPYAV